MAVTFLARATARNELRKGAVVTVKPEWWTWGGLETLPDFIKVTVTGMGMREAKTFQGSHQRRVTLVTENSDFVNDVFTMRAESNLVGSSGQGGITQAQVQSVLDKWNLTFIDAANDAVRFTATIEQVLQSEGFWQRDPTPFNLTQTDYTDPDHTMTADIGAVPFNIVSDIITSRGGEVDAFAAGTVTLRADRTDAKRMFENLVIDAVNQTIFKARWYFTVADVDDVVNNFAGERTITRAQFLAAIQDEMS